MPRPAFNPRHEAEESPYRRVNAWDDGAYFSSSSPSPGDHHDHRAPRHNNHHQHHDRYARSPSPPNFRGRAADHAAAGAGGARPPLTRSKSTSAKAFAKQGLSQLQHLSPQWQKAAKAALQAGGMAALAQRNKAGAWTGAKGARVATAALGAAAADVWANRQKEKREGNNRDRSRDRGGDYTYESSRRSRDRSLDRSRDRGYDTTRDRSRDRHHDDSRRRRDYDSDRDYHDNRRDTHRGRDRSRDRGGHDDSRGRGKSKKRGEIEVIGEMVGGFILDQIAKKATKVRS